MFCVISCKKYRHKGIRVFDFGDHGPVEKIKSLPNFECKVCGPFSHVEMSWEGYWDILSSHETAEDALTARKTLIDLFPETYRDD